MSIVVNPLDVILQVLNDKDGKDKSAKIIQYSCRLLVTLMPPLSGQPQHQKPRHLLALISQLSMFRKIIRLGNWLTTYREMQLKGLKNCSLAELADVYTELADDALCLSKMGVLNRKIGQRADYHAIHGWFLSILIGLYKQWTVYCRTGQYSGLKTCKLLADGIFCFIDVIDWSTPKAYNIQTVSGLTSAFLSYYKIYTSIYIDMLLSLQKKQKKEHEHKDHDHSDPFDELSEK